jgi:hypothetical protein
MKVRWLNYYKNKSQKKRNVLNVALLREIIEGVI